MLRRRKRTAAQRRVLRHGAQLQGIQRFKKDRALLERLLEWGRDGKVGRVFRDTSYSNMYYLVPGDPTEQELAQTLVGENPEPGAYEYTLKSLVSMTSSDLRSLAEQYGYEDEWDQISKVYKERESRKKRSSVMRQGVLHPRLARKLRSRSGCCQRTRLGAKWEDLPRGWTEESLDSFWNSVGGSVTKCIEEMKKNPEITDPGAFCASLADRATGSEAWRHEPRKRRR
jgi:hypothetical protein